MIDYRGWKESPVSVTRLYLDPDNPRIPSGDHLAQKDLIAELVENDDVYDLAKSIVENGYFPVESLIYVLDGTKKYVLEGNRRLAALKILLSPEIAPSDWQRRFRALSNRVDPATISRVKAICTPSREAAAPLIMSKHTRGQVESWTPIMQDKFYRKLVEKGLSVSEIASQYKIKPSEITDSLLRYSMYSIACELPLPEDITKILHNPRKFPVTTLERIYKYPKFKDFLGITFDKEKRLCGEVDIEEFKKGYAKIVSDIVLEEIDSRKLNNIDAMDNYLKSLDDFMPDKSKKGAFADSDFLNLPPFTKPKTPGTQPATQKKAKPIKTVNLALIPIAITCDVNNQRINDVFRELIELPVAKYPNAVGLMFRSLLEMALSYHIYRTGHLEIMRDAEKQKRNGKLPNKWHPTLHEMLVYVARPEPDIIRNSNITGAINKLISQKDSILSIDSLNLFVHNEHFHPTEEILRAFWPQLQGLFEIILAEPEARIS